MSRSYKTVTPEEIKATATTWAHLAKHTDWTAPKVGLALLADRDRLAAELARVRKAATLILAEAEDVMDRYESRCPIQAGELQRAIDEIRAALAQPQDGTTEGRAT